MLKSILEFLLSFTHIEMGEMKAMFRKRRKNVECSMNDYFDSARRAFQINAPVYFSDMTNTTLNDALKVHRMVYFDDLEAMHSMIDEHISVQDCLTPVANIFLIFCLIFPTNFIII
jgi:hypothetical protein